MAFLLLWAKEVFTEADAILKVCVSRWAKQFNYSASAISIENDNVINLSEFNTLDNSHEEIDVTLIISKWSPFLIQGV